MYLTVMVLPEDLYSRNEPSQTLPKTEDPGSPSIISRDSLAQLRLLEQREGQASAFRIVVPPAGSLPCPDPMPSQSFVHQTSQAWCPQGRRLILQKGVLVTQDPPPYRGCR